jgi:CheY-like chemotaxis protein
LSNRQKEFIETLQLSANSLLDLINDLLDIAKIEARTVELEEVPFSVVKSVDDVVSIMAVKAREKGLTFTVNCECQCIHTRTFIGDPTRLRQIILNLCSNALKFTEHGGVEIAIRCEEMPNAAYENVTIAVKDTGIGIAPSHVETIFGKFVQADSSINRKYGGTGLGLAITRTLAELMGGTIGVSSTMGKGSEFRVTLPLKRLSHEGRQLEMMVEAAPQLAAETHERILLVEDYAPNVLVATAFLEDFGYVCDVASNGMEAVEKVISGAYLVVLMDVQMHGMNGLEATRMIRQHERENHLPPIPIIGMTAHALYGDKERCIESGMDDYIPKPFDPAQLKSKIMHFSRSRASAA